MSRRRKGEGSIYQRADGKWVAIFDLGWQLGKRRKKYLYGKTAQEVQHKLEQLKLERARTGMVAEGSQTVAQFLVKWLDASVKSKVRPKTYVSYESICRLHLIPLLGKIRLAKLSPQQVQEVINHLIGSGLSAKTVWNVRAVLRRALQQAVKWELVPRNVASLADPPHLERKEITPLLPEEIKRFLEAVRGDRLEVLYLLTIATGLRRGEVLALQWSDLNEEQSTLQVRRAIQRVNGRLMFVETKTARSRRGIHLPHFALEALRIQRERQEAERERVGEYWHDEGLIFTTQIGTPLDGDNVLGYFQRALRKAGIRHQRFHDLRHACATMLLQQGVSMRTIADVLGHSQISITMDIYSHVMPCLKREAAAKMDELLGTRRSEPSPTGESLPDSREGP